MKMLHDQYQPTVIAGNGDDATRQLSTFSEGVAYVREVAFTRTGSPYFRKLGAPSTSVPVVRYALP